MITEQLISEYLRTVYGAQQAMTSDPPFNMQFNVTRLLLTRLEMALCAEGCDVWRAERIMRAVLGTMEDPQVALQRVSERAITVQKSMLN